MTRKHLMKMKWAWSRHTAMHTRGHLRAILKRDVISVSVRSNRIAQEDIWIRASFTVHGLTCDAAP
jgi:hypothetical protein